MRYTIFEDPITHNFTLLVLPYHFLDGDKLPIPPTNEWFASYDDVVASLPELLNRED